ncbi:MAG: uroporphyrinogen decarboxylase family protein [Coriobacteriia bacterium]
MPAARGDARTILALLGGPAAPVATGLTFVASEALEPLARGVETPAARLARACDELALDFAFVPVTAPWASEACAALVAAGRAPLVAIDGPLARAARQEGVEEVLKATVLDPDGVRALLRLRMRAVAEDVARASDMGASAVVVCEDLAGSAGPIVSPDWANEDLFPLLAEVVAEATGAGLHAVLHCDGDFRAFLPAIARAGLVAVHGGGHGAAGLDGVLAAARAAGVAFVGGLPTEALDAGLPATIAAGRRVGVLALSGGLLIADDGGITSAVQVAFLASAFSAARSTGRG